MSKHRINAGANTELTAGVGAGLDASLDASLDVALDAALVGDEPSGLTLESDSRAFAASTNTSSAGASFDLLALRIGQGADVHAFKVGRKLILGGVEIPHYQGLDGHSDADVLTHAISDALLGAARMGDIGKFFPPNDPAYKDACSLDLLAEVARVIREEGFLILDIDSVIAAQEPKLSPYRNQMRANIAATLGLSPDNVGVKATTTEWLGFEGREEGISATASCLLYKER